ncbi:alpha/beta fold hydrolase [Pseudonocardia kunmingensis]|uniref:Pimeloyl-ACP methyl ester carboxylesterase n=1 Tax=Pseudonocardia kunmingensis TaxID=630975 RepID=A0A543DPI5_9PSEU|nr:alpha/beta hydrolase [Pseudonocardia kunmingensis]TQM11250.1 pimeloyl-ACP methyl ester carboxylesterase [Pseudonocardia kunmingensis]
MGADDEFSMLADNAAEVGLAWTGPPAVRREGTDVGDGRRVSALRWGDAAPRAVFLHGGGQNAHTWDTVVLALGIPALAVDLPGHGHSDWRADRDYGPWAAAEAVAPAVRRWAPQAEVVVGMSLGGLTTIRLAAAAPDVVRRAVVVDVTPSVLRRTPAMSRAQRGTTALIGDGGVFATREEMVERAVAAAPQRPRSSLARGVVHNSRQRADGRWEWRYDRQGGPGDYTPLWADLGAATVPMTLVRGGDSAFVSDEDAEEFRLRRPGAEVHVVPAAGHSVQSDQPLALAGIIRSALASATPQN